MEYNLERNLLVVIMQYYVAYFGILQLPYCSY